MSEMDNVYGRIEKQREIQATKYVINQTPILSGQDVITTAQELVDDGFVDCTPSGKLEIVCEGDLAYCDDEYQ